MSRVFMSRVFISPILFYIMCAVLCVFHSTLAVLHAMPYVVIFACRVTCVMSVVCHDVELVFSGKCRQRVWWHLCKWDCFLLSPSCYIIHAHHHCDNRSMLTLLCCVTLACIDINGAGCLQYLRVSVLFCSVDAPLMVWIVLAAVWMTGVRSLALTKRSPVPQCLSLSPNVHLYRSVISRHWQLWLMAWRGLLIVNGLLQLGVLTQQPLWQQTSLSGWEDHYIYLVERITISIWLRGSLYLSGWEDHYIYLVERITISIWLRGSLYPFDWEDHSIRLV